MSANNAPLSTTTNTAGFPPAPSATHQESQGVVTAILSNFRRNCVGTTSFAAKFAGMRKPQDFIIYPIPSGVVAHRILIQSDTRIGYVYLETGLVDLAGPFPGGASLSHFAFARIGASKLSGEALLLLKSHVAGSASPQAGSCGLVVDNGGAGSVIETLPKI